MHALAVQGAKPPLPAVTRPILYVVKPSISFLGSSISIRASVSMCLGIGINGKIP